MYLKDIRGKQSIYIFKMMTKIEAYTAPKGIFVKIYV